MPINRYSNISQSKFDPLSFQELSALPFAQRKQHDAAAAQADELSAIQSKRLAPDEQGVSGAIGNYQTKVDDYINRLNTEGFSNTTKSDIRDLVRERKDLMSPTGIVGKGTAAYNAYQANAKDLQKLYSTGKISKDKYERGLNSSLEAYTAEGGASGGAQYNAFSAVQDEDINKRAREIALDIQRNPRKLEQLGITAEKLPNGLTRYYDTKQGREVTLPGAISAGIQSILGQDPNVVSDLQQRSELGLIGNPQEYLKNLGGTYESLYSKDNKSISRSGFNDPLELARAKKQLDESSKQGSSVPYVNDPVQSKQISEESFITTLDKIAGDDLNTVPNKSLYQYNVGLKARTTPFSTKDLSDTEKERFKSIGDKLTTQGLIPEGASEKESAKVISSYLSKYKDVQYSNSIVKPLSSSGPISSSLLLNTSNIAKTNKELTNEINSGGSDGEGRTKLWDKKGNSIKKDDLPDGFSVEYIGYVSPSNVLPTFKNANKKQSVVPHVVQIKDADGKVVNEVYASRNDFETSKPEFEAFEIIKNTTNAGIDTPGLVNDFKVQKSSSLYRSGVNDYHTSYDPLTKTYSVGITLQNGKKYSEQGLSPEKYETFWYNLVQRANKKQ